MAHSKQLQGERRAEVVATIGRLIARRGLLGTPTNARHELGECFEIYLLRADDIRKAMEGHTSLAKLLSWSGEWHCQVIVDGKPTGFARCAEPHGESGEWKIQSMFQSHLAERVAKAVHHLDKEHPERETEVKLFFAPAFHLYAFLLERSHDSHVLVVDSPFSGLAGRKEFHTEAEFLNRLQALRPIQGLVPGRIPRVTITPQNISLTETTSATFRAYDDQGAPVSAIWTITPPAIGTVTPAGAAIASVTYTSPLQISGPQAVTITAAASGASASASVFLTPSSVQIVPVSVQLKRNQTQQFIAIVSGDSKNEVTWVLSPDIGTISPNGLYTPPTAMVSDTTPIKVMAVSARGQKIADSTITLIPPPWASWKRNLLGAYLLGVFLLTFLLVDLWPPSGPDPLLTAARQAAQAKVDSDDADLKLATEAAALPAVTPPLTPAARPTIESATDASSLEALRKKRADDDKALQDAKDKENASIDPLDRAGPNASGYASRLGATLPREVDLLLLVLIGGALGAFIHCVRSFTAFAGNEDLRGSWAWWYYFHPFLGATLSLASYMALRGGFLIIATGSSTKTSEMNPFALTGLALLVGMFSKNAITKLAELFDTLFQPSNPKALQNPLGQTSVPPGSASLRITSMTPTLGPSSGGNPITITGAGFKRGAIVNIGGIPATNTQFVDTTSIMAVTPLHPVGDATVEVVNPDGQKGVSTIGYRYI